MTERVMSVRRKLLCFALSGILLLPGCGYSESQMQEAWDEGYQEGYEDGKEYGAEEGYSEGYTDGEGYGYENGRESGYSDGYDDGYSDGYDEASGVSNNSYTYVPPPPQSNQTTTVYVTDYGDKYHRWGCQYLWDSSNAISLTTAIARGYTACSRRW